jgi:LacI family transcriptional regulator
MQLAQIIKPKLTIVTQPLEEIGKSAADILLARFTNPEAEPKTVTLSTDIALGHSVKKI